MTSAVTGDDAKALLLANHLPEGDVDLKVNDVDVTVRVRGLSRDEVVRLSGDKAAVEVQMLAAAMVAPPVTEDEAAAWRQGAPAPELRKVLDAIEELSGFGKAYAKAAWKEMESDPDAEFRDVPGPEAGDDGGAPEG